MRRVESWTRYALLAWATAVTVARAARFPNNFAEAHWLLDYRFGLIKRGFAGSALWLAAATGLTDQSERIVMLAAFAAFALFAVVLGLAARRVLASGADPALSFAAVAVFASSPFVVMTAHFMGYLDHLVFAAAFGAAWLARGGRLWAAGALAAAGVLVHESFTVVGLPLVLAGAALCPRERRPARNAALPFLLPIAAGALLWMSETFLLDLRVLRGQLAAHLTAFPFVGGDMNLFVPEWLTTGTLASWREQRHAFWRHMGDPNLLRLMVPSALFLLLAGAALSPARTRARRLLGSAVVAALPLAMHAVAWDTARIWTYPIVVAFGCVWLQAGDGPSEPAPGRRWLLLAASAIVVANIFARSPLMDAEVERFTATARALLYLPFLAGTAVVFAAGRRQSGT